MSERKKNKFRSIFRMLYRAAQKIFKGLGLRRIGALNKIRIFVAEHAKEETAVVNGHILHLDVSEGINLEEGFEENTTALARREIRPGNVVVDIGADIGYYTCLAADLAGASGKILAFEPNRRSFSILEKNITENRFPNVTAINKAVSDVPGSIPFFEHGPHSALGYDRFATRKPAYSAEAVRLDDFLKGKTERVDFVKIDVEGSEWRVFKGMRGILLANKNIKIVFEFYPLLIEKSGGRPLAMLEDIQALGFAFYDVNRDGESEKAISLQELVRRYPPEDGSMTNVFAKR